MDCNSKRRRDSCPHGNLLRVALLVLLAGVPTGLQAATLSLIPLSIVLRSNPRIGTLTIKNENTERVTLQIQMTSWRQDAEGKDIYEPTTDLVFYPHILTIEGGKEGIVRMGYDHAGALRTERCYRLFAQELPIRKPGETVVKIAARIGIPVFVTPSNPSSKVSIAAPEIVQGRLRVRLTNSGNAHTRIQKVVITGLDSKGDTAFSATQNGWYVLPGASRVFTFDGDIEAGRETRILQIVGVASGGTVKGQFNVDASFFAPLQEGAATKSDSKPPSPSPTP